MIMDLTSTTLCNMTIINGVDIWSTFGAFLTEEKRGGRENLAAIMTASKTKAHVSVNIREANGARYPKNLRQKNEERDVTLHFALFARSKAEWMTKYRDFIKFLKSGNNGWLDIYFPGLGLKLHVFYVDSPLFKPLTYLWIEGVHASRFKVRFREPDPIL